MTRLLGAAFLTAASVLAGFYAGARVKLKCETLAQCTALTAFFASAISHSGESLPVIVQRACKSGSFNLLGFLETINNSDLSEGFGAVWGGSLEKTSACLDTQNKNLLKSFGARLGKTDAKDQVELCEFYRSRFEFNEAQLRKKCTEQVKLCRVAGAAVGVLLFVFLSGG